MKWVFFFVGMMLISLASGLSTTLAPAYDRQETAIVEITGQVSNAITPAMLELYRGNVLVPWQYDIKRIDTRVFFWGVMPEMPGNYTIRLKNVQTLAEGNPATIDYYQNVSVRASRAGYYVTPGMLYDEHRTELTITSLRDTDQNIAIGGDSILLRPGQNKYNVTSVPGKGVRFLQVGWYSLPVWRSDEAGFSGSLPFSLTPGFIAQHVARGVKPASSFIISNNDNVTHTYKITFNETLIDVSDNSFELKPQSSMNVSFSFLDSLDDDRATSLLIQSGNVSYPFSIVYTVRVPINRTTFNTTLPVDQPFCEELAGKICGGTEQCDGESKTLKSISGTTVTCCLSTCSPQTNKQWVVGSLLFVFAAVLIAGAYYYYRKNKPEQQFSKNVRAVEKKLIP